MSTWADLPTSQRAHRLAALGFTVIPVRPGTKKAAVRWEAYQSRKPTFTEMARWFSWQEDKPMAIVTGAASGVVVVDADSQAALDWAEGHLPLTTLRVLTSEKEPGFRGRHLFYRHPGQSIRNKARIRTDEGKLALDIRGDGGYVLAPGSLHPGGLRYDPVGDWTPEALQALPVFEAEWLEPPAPEEEPTAKKRGRPARATSSAADRARQWLEKREPAIQGQGGDEWTFKTACAMVRGFRLDDSEALELLLPWNDACSPPWREEDLAEKIRNARAHGTEPFGYLLDVPAPAKNGKAAGPVIVPSPDPNGFPVIIVGGALPPVTTEALAALHAINDPPRLFQQGDALLRLDRDRPGGSLRPFPLGETGLRGEMARSARWIRLTQKGEEKPVPPPRDVVQDLASLPPSTRGLPHLDRLVRTPVFTASGELLDQPGYHAESGTIYCPPPGFTMDAVPEHPSGDDLAWAADLLLEDLFGDFPFTNPASRAHAVAATLLPFARGLVDGVTPLHHVGAPVQGTGKGLLVSVMLLPSLGEEPPALLHQAAPGSEEWRKAITACLTQAPSVILLDNLEGRLDSQHLAACLTMRTWSDRLLSASTNVSASNQALWVATGNNVEFHPEIERRVVAIDLDAGVANPEERADFRHPDLLDWATRNRPALVRACLVLIRAWMDQGRPEWKPGPDAPLMGSFEPWCRVLGGILEVAGVTGFLSNRLESRGRTGQVEEEWNQFLTAWWDQHDQGAVTANDLWPDVEAKNLLCGSLTSSQERGRRTQLGALLRSRRNRPARLHLGDQEEVVVRLVEAGQHRNYGKRYRLLKLEEGSAGSAASCGYPVENAEPAEPQDRGSAGRFRTSEVNSTSRLRGGAEPAEPVSSYACEDLSLFEGLPDIL